MKLMLTRKHFGTIDDFFLTSMASQMDSMSFLREVHEKRLLPNSLIFRSLIKYKLARKDAADLRGVIKRMESKGFDEQIRKKSATLEDIRMDIDEQINKCEKLTCSIESLNLSLRRLTKQSTQFLQNY